MQTAGTLCANRGPEFLILNFSFSIVLAQFAFFKQRHAHGQRRAGITGRVAERLADVIPVKRAFARVDGVGKPEKLPVWNDAVKRRGPPRAVRRRPAEKIIRHQPGQKNRRTDRQRRNHVKPRRARQRDGGENPQREQNQDSRRQQVPVHLRRRAEAFHLFGELKNDERRERRENQHRKHRVAHKRAPQEKIAEGRQRVGQQNSAAKNPNRRQIRFAVGIKRHAAREQHANHVDISQNRERHRQPGEFGQQKLRAPDRFRQNRQRRAGADFPRERRRRAQHRAEQSRQQHRRQRGIFHQLRLIAKREVIRHREKKFKQHGTGQQQQKDGLPDQFHEGVRRNGEKLTHLGLPVYPSKKKMPAVNPFKAQIIIRFRTIERAGGVFVQNQSRTTAAPSTPAPVNPSIYPASEYWIKLKADHFKAVFVATSNLSLFKRRGRYRHSHGNF